MWNSFWFDPSDFFGLVKCDSPIFVAFAQKQGLVFCDFWNVTILFGAREVI